MKNNLTSQHISALKAVRDASAQENIPILLVGAIARILSFNQAFGVPVHRTTNDCDFAVQVASWNAFRALCDRLTQHAGITPLTHHRFRHQASQVLIDLIPFGGVEKDGRIQWPNDGKIMTIHGFDEAFEHAAELTLDKGLSLRVVTPALLVALKFFAFSDRGDTDDRDLRDIWEILRHFPATGREHELFESPLADLVSQDKFEHGFAGSMLVNIDEAIEYGRDR